MSEDEKREERIRMLRRLLSEPRSHHAWWHYQLFFRISRMATFVCDKPIKIMVDGKEVEL